MPLPRSASVRYSGVFAPNSGIRSLVVLAGDQAPTRRKKGAPADLPDPAPDTPADAKSTVAHALAALDLATDSERLARAEQDRKASTRMTWAAALQAAWGIDILACIACGGRKQVIAAIPLGPIATKILRHVGLPTQVETKAEPCDIWRVRGPPGTYLPDDFGDDAPQDGAGLIEEVYEDDDMRPFFHDEPLLAKAA